MKLNISEILEILQDAPALINAIAGLVHHPKVQVVDSEGATVAPADVVSQANAVKAVNSIG